MPYIHKMHVFNIQKHVCVLYFYHLNIKHTCVCFMFRIFLNIFNFFLIFWETDCLKFSEISEETELKFLNTITFEMKVYCWMSLKQRCRKEEKSCALENRAFFTNVDPHHSLPSEPHVCTESVLIRLFPRGPHNLQQVRSLLTCFSSVLIFLSCHRSSHDNIKKYT